jgi:hypothetical protein
MAATTASRSTSALRFGGLIDLSTACSSITSASACLFGGIYLIWRIINSRFGMVVQGIRSNEQRMQAIGYHANRYRLVCFVISGTICGLAGALLANNTDFVSPAGMYWTRSGELMVMVVFGGMGSLFGPVIGTIVFLLLEELLSQFTEYWALIMGPLLLLIVLFARGGIMGLLGRFAVPDPMLRVENLVAALVASRPPTICRSTSPRRAARHHRPERRRQDHADQPVDRAADAEFRRHSLRRPRRHLAAVLSAQPARPGALVPDHLPAAGFHGADNVALGRRRHMTATRSASGALPARRSICATRRRPR